MRLKFFYRPIKAKSLVWAGTD
jgi:hypothetical protein